MVVSTLNRGVAARDAVQAKGGEGFVGRSLPTLTGLDLLASIQSAHNDFVLRSYQHPLGYRQIRLAVWYARHWRIDPARVVPRSVVEEHTISAAEQNPAREQQLFAFAPEGLPRRASVFSASLVGTGSWLH